MQSALTFSLSHHPLHPLFFNSPFLSHFPIFSPFQLGWSYRGGERCQMIWLSILYFVPQALTWAFIVVACLSHNLLSLEDQTPCSCRPELKRILHGTVALGSMKVRVKRLTRFPWRRLSKLCKMKVFLSIIAGCKRHNLQNRRYRFWRFQASTISSKKHEASAERKSLNGLVRQVGTAVARPGLKRSVLAVCRLLACDAQPVAQWLALRASLMLCSRLRASLQNALKR